MKEIITIHLKNGSSVIFDKNNITTSTLRGLEITQIEVETMFGVSTLDENGIITENGVAKGIMEDGDNE